MPAVDPHWLALPQRYLHIGQGGIFLRPTLVQTVLGSCVAVVLHAKEYGVGGIFHAFLPNQPQCPLAEDEGAFRYVDAGTRLLARLFARSGIASSAIVAKLFGGSVSLGLRPEEAVGTKNAVAARAAVAELGIPVVAERLGGNTGYKLFFHTSSGEVLIKRLRGPQEIASLTCRQ
jgi:chemotaxis protein CheD